MIISNNEGGLSNRIKSLVSVIRISKIKNTEYKVCWDILNDYNKKKHILNCPFNSLFKNDILVNIIPSESIQYNNHCLYICNNDKIPKKFNNFESNCKKTFSKKYGSKTIDFMYNKIPLELKNEYINYFKLLKPIDKLKKKIDKFCKNFNSKTISIHIRSWNRKNENGRSNLFNYNKFENEIEKYDNSYNFFLCSDSQKVKDYFKNKYGDRILLYPRKTDLDTSRDFPEGIQEDLIELYLLSKNNIIIGSHFSTYTEVAWWLNGCTDNITIL